MRTPVRDHVPSRPTWRCRACGIAWPCSPAKLLLLARYRGDMPGLMVHLVTLREEAAADRFAQHYPGAQPADLHRRFTDWVPIRSP
ncbi:flavin reductase [Micromonospora echinofusca]|uniref:flavin reductase n=1 Tax=Micromonospora echinofusca TaxID=47858 RepID=UPI0020205432|nr:flavin reductase [Micromonospora sp. MSM11]MCL7455683.1 flavin reductase [Micromonospora sp. MSM11]